MKFVHKVKSAKSEGPAQGRVLPGSRQDPRRPGRGQGERGRPADGPGGAAAPQRLLIVSFFGVSADLINTFELGKALIWIELILYPQCFSIVHSVHSSYMLSQISWR